MLTRSGLVKIVDFGIAKLLGVTGPTQTGTTLGTVAYMSPEQVACEGLDQQCDVWSLGAVFYELLTGRPPFDGDSEWAVMNAIRTQEPKTVSSLRSDSPDFVDALVARALAKKRSDRFESARAFAEAAQQCRDMLAPARRHGCDRRGDRRAREVEGGRGVALVASARRGRGRLALNP